MPVQYGCEVQIDNHPERSDPPEDNTHSTGRFRCEVWGRSLIA